MAGKRIIVFSLLVLVGLALAAFASSGTQAQSYKRLREYSVDPTTASTATDTIDYTASALPDYNYEDSSMYTLTPVDLHAVTGGQLPIGAGVGALDSQSTVGLLNGPCSTNLPTTFEMYNASVDTSDVLGPAEMLWVLKDKDDHPIPYGADNPELPDYLEAYPHFVNDGFDPDGDGPEPPLQPRARYAGHDFVAANNILIQMLVFNPGQLEQMGGLYAELDASVGGVTIVVLNNPVNQAEAPGSISDFCTPLETTTTVYGTTTDNPDTTGVDESGYANQSNPAAGAGVLGTGTMIARNYSRSERDADGDGYENDLDPCPYTVDAGWDPRVDCTGGCTGDDDGDGLPNSCDPDDGTFDKDEDNDGYENRQDICPLVQNGCTQTTGCGPIANPAWDNQADSESVLPQDANADVGPNPDSMGDACDDSDDDGVEDFGAGAGTTQGSGNCDDGVDNDGDTLIDGNDPDCADFMDAGEIALGNPDAQIWGTNPSTGQFFHSMGWAAACVGATDSDDDGYCDDLETALGSPTDDGSESDGSLDGGAYCAGFADDDGDGYVNDGCPLAGKYAEVGAECGDGVTLNTTNDDAGTDANDGGKVNDGCPVIGVPESLVIDTGITLGATALPGAAAPESCNDGVDNDGDGDFDGDDDDANGCDPTTYNPDTDRDGVENDGSDNCPDDWNPEQTDTDGDGTGDACDNEDDGDNYNDVIEWWVGTDPLDDCPQDVGKHDAWPLDINKSRDVSVTGDVFNYVGKIGCLLTVDLSCRRLDLNGSGDISVTGDVFQYVGKIGQTCTP